MLPIRPHLLPQISGSIEIHAHVDLEMGIEKENHHETTDVDKCLVEAMGRSGGVELVCRCRC